MVLWRAEWLLWLPSVMQDVSDVLCASDRLRSSVRPLNAAFAKAAGLYGDLRIGSKSLFHVWKHEALGWFS